MKFQLTGYIRRPTNEQLLNDLKKTAKKIRKSTISNKHYRQTGTYCPSIITRRFGTWNKALQKAGLKIKKHQNIPIPQLFDNLHHLWITLGRQPYLSDLYPPCSRFGRRPYLRTFGKWSTALEKFIAHRKNPLITPPAPPVECLQSHGRSSGVRSALRPPAPRAHLTWRLRHLIMKRDNFRCKACGASPANDPAITLHIDHIIPSSKGGKSIPENLQTLSSICNIGKSNL